MSLRSCDYFCFSTSHKSKDLGITGGGLTFVRSVKKPRTFFAFHDVLRCGHPHIEDHQTQLCRSTRCAAPTCSKHQSVSHRFRQGFKNQEFWPLHRLDVDTLVYSRRSRSCTRYNSFEGFFCCHTVKKNLARSVRLF